MMIIKQIRLIIGIGLATILFSGCSITAYLPDLPSLSTGSSEPTTVVKDDGIKDSAAMHKATMRPYQIHGKWYYPTVVEVGETFDGIASWYGPKFHGKKTSNGETYNMHKRTAAHKTLPMNTMVKVVNKRNGRATIVRINDRGPFVSGRIIDLSNVAAKEIDMVGAGTAPVTLEVLGFRGTIAKLTDTESSKRSMRIGAFAVQVGAFKNIEGAKIYQKRYANIDSAYQTVIKPSLLDGEKIYRVWVSGFRSEEEARDFLNDNDLNGAFIIGE